MWMRDSVVDEIIATNSSEWIEQWYALLQNIGVTERIYLLNRKYCHVRMKRQRLFVTLWKGLCFDAEK